MKWLSGIQVALVISIMTLYVATREYTILQANYFLSRGHNATAILKMSIPKKCYYILPVILTCSVSNVNWHQIVQIHNNNSNNGYVTKTAHRGRSTNRMIYAAFIGRFKGLLTSVVTSTDLK